MREIAQKNRENGTYGQDSGRLSLLGALLE